MKKLNAFSIVAFVLSLVAIEFAAYLIFTTGILGMKIVPSFATSNIVFYIYLGLAIGCAAPSIALAYLAKGVQKKVFKTFNTISIVLSIVAISLAVVCVIITMLMRMGVIQL